MRRTFLLSFLLTILFSATVYASGTYAIVTGSVVNVRSYGEISDNRLFQVPMGTVVEVHGVCGDFFRATVMGISDVYIAREFTRITRAQGTVISELAWVYDLPGEEGGTAIQILPLGEAVTAVSTYGNWFGIEWGGETVFVKRAEVEIPYFAELPVARIGTTLADAIIETAKTYIGTRYQWGGTGPGGFDCSGFMFYIWSKHGFTMNRSSRCQAQQGVFVARSDLERGDLVFFGHGSNITHVGMYIGGGKFIHSSSDRTGGVRLCSLYASQGGMVFITARRIII